jgi:hypothetical protein
MSETIDARLANDRFVHISRWQVPVLPNFAMTDYSSQGKTREFNVIDLANAYKFQAAYTCLSRGTSLEGTIIMRNFSDSLLTATLDSDMKHEFCKLNYLDRITDLRYNGLLPPEIVQETRWATIDRYVAWKSTNEEDDWHPAIRHLTKAEQANRGRVSQVWQGTESSLKRRSLDESSARPKKRKRTMAQNREATTLAHAWANPVGLIWDGNDYSCAFDTWTCVLHSLWKEDEERWGAHLSMYSTTLGAMTNGFQEIQRRDPAVEMTEVRNTWRRHMRGKYPGEYGTRGVEMVLLSKRLLGDSRLSSTANVTCSGCGKSDRRRGLGVDPITRLTVLENASSIEEAVVARHEVLVLCKDCRGEMRLTHKYDDMIAFAVMSVSDIQLNGRVDVGQNGLFRLQSVIYHGNFHFIARVILKTGKVYAHDGMHGTHSEYEGVLGSDHFPLSKLNTCQGKTPSIAIYVRETPIEGEPMDVED